MRLSSPSPTTLDLCEAQPDSSWAETARSRDLIEKFAGPKTVTETLFAAPNQLADILTR
jgi:hypothetical protein